MRRFINMYRGLKAAWLQLAKLEAARLHLRLLEAQHKAEIKELKLVYDYQLGKTDASFRYRKQMLASRITWLENKVDVLRGEPLQYQQTGYLRMFHTTTRRRRIMVQD